jgi:hypothetical protein
LFQRNFKFWITSLVIFDLLLMPNSTEMNRLDDLRKNRTSVAVLGINQNGLEIALSIAKNFPVIISDTNINPEVKVQDFLLSRGLSVDSKITEKGNISLSESKTDLSSAGVFYLNGLSTSLVDWTEIKATTGRAAASLSAGDWVIFGEDIDPDLAEVILVDILESKSGLTLGAGFEVSFSPKILAHRNFANLGNDMKMSHNLIISHVETILGHENQDEFKSNQINYLNEIKEVSRIHSRIKDQWVPMLKEMDSNTFSDFVEQTVHKSFRDVYSHFRFSNEIKVNYYRFFKIAKRKGLKHSLSQFSKDKGWSAAI